MIWKGFFSCIKSKKKLLILDEWYNYCSEKKFPLKIKYIIKIFTNAIIAILIIISKLLKMALASNYMLFYRNAFEFSRFVNVFTLSWSKYSTCPHHNSHDGLLDLPSENSESCASVSGVFCQTQPAIINYMLFKVTIFHWERIFMKEDIFWCNWNRVKYYRKLMFLKFILKPFTWW